MDLLYKSCLMVFASVKGEWFVLNVRSVCVHKSLLNSSVHMFERLHPMFSLVNEHLCLFRSFFGDTTVQHLFINANFLAQICHASI